MANPGGVGSKFVSWNLNKSYGKPPGAPSHATGPSGARFRSANHGSGGMVVLSRPRATLSGAPKAGGRLSVPPPLNLPSLRKEHERFDMSASGGPNGAGDTGSGSGHASASMGWTKPGFLEKDTGGMQQEGRETGSNAYMPPAARMGSAPAVVLPRAVIPAEKAVLLRGEDFPSLQASLPNSSSGPTQKQKDAPKQKQNLSKEVTDEKMENAKSESPLRMRPQVHSSRFTGGHSWDQNGASGHRLSDGLSVSRQSRKQDGIFSDPLPLVRLSHTSDWADDERDTGHSIPDRDRDYGFSRGEREYDATRTGLSRQSGHAFPDGRGIGDTENGKALVRGDTYGKDVRTPSREGRDGNSWRGLPLQKDGFKSQEMNSERNEIGGRAFGLSRETAKHNINKYNDYGDSSRNSFGRMSNGNHESWYSRRDLGYGPTRQNGTHLAESFNGRGSERSTGTGGRYSDTLSKRYRGDMFQSSSVSFGSKGFSGIDPILNFGRDKQMVSNSGKTYADNAFSSPGFDERDPFSGGLLFKKKKDVVKQTDFHDPVRESFEAELERVQMMQDQERQRVAEEQARALELARKEEEERQRLAREEEEKRRRLEVEAREAAWKAEQERLEAMRRAEEQRIAREEEKKRFLLEDERRKEAARKKLLELEARIARRQADSRNNDRLDEKMPQTDVQRVTDNRDWEDGERMVERITSSASSDSSGLNRTLETGTRPHLSRDGGTSFLDRGKHVHSWKRDAFENANSSSSLLHDQYNGYHSPRRDLFGEGKSFPRKDFFGGPSVMPMRKGGISEAHTMDGLSQSRGQRWNLPMENVTYNRESEFDPEFSENPMDKFGDIGWGQSHSRDIPHSLNVDRYYQNPEVDGFSSFSRSRHLVRQPRVLPPPSISSMQSSFRLQSYRSGSPAFLDDEMRYSHGDRNENVVHSDYESGYQETLGQSEIINPSPQEGYSSQVQIIEKNTPRCDSQSSLSVTSPPNSPTHLSHDDLDDSGESQDPSVVNMTEQAAFSDSEQALSASEDVPQNIVTANSDPTADDEEWAIENSEELQEQEEYDEEEDGYQEEDEVHGDDENLDLAHEFTDFHPAEQSGISKAEQLVLGFDEGVEVRVLSPDDFEGPSNNSEKVESFDGLVNNGQIVKAESNLYEGGLGNSDNKIQETGKALQDMVLHSTNTSQALDSVETSINSATLSPQQLTVPSTVNLTLPTQSVQPTPSTVSSVSHQTEVPPVKLQFGLFSGPSLIPSPVPAIQIGSIQMPLHLHPQVGSPITQIPPPQPPFFQFGQLRYTSPVSQGILPWGPRAMSFVQPSVPTPYSVNQHTGGFINNQAGEDSSANLPHSGNMISSVLTDNQSGLDPKFLKPAHGNPDKEVKTLPITNSAEKETPPQNGAENPKFDGDKTVSPSISPVEGQDYHNKAVKRNHKPVANNGEMRRQSSQFSTERVGGGSKSRGVVPGGKGKRFLYTARNASSWSSFPSPSEASHADSSGFQRRARRNIRRIEFRVRENVDRRQLEHLALSNYPQQEEKSNTNGKVIGSSMRSSGKEGLTNKLTKPESESSLTSSSFPSRNIDSESKIEKVNECSPSKRHISAVEGRAKVSGCLGDDVDPPLQSGVVRIFKQPGIEVPSDEDDFIEVRSKRQMLNDRREQKEKDIKAKSRVIKAPRKPAFQQSTSVSSNSNRVDLSSLREDIPNTIRCETDVKGRGSSNVETPMVASIASAHLTPVGTSVLNRSQGDTSYHSMNSFQKGPAPVISNEGANLTSGLSFDNKNVVMEHVPTSLAPWANPRISQVMALTQTQLDEAMKPARFDARVAPISSETNVVLEPSKPLTSILPQSSKPFFSSARPLNYLLAGEKIQFGAVTSPTILPPSSLPGSNGMGTTSLCGSDVSMDEKFSSAEGDSTIFFNKDKHLDKSCLHLEDPEAEAEAAASAVAVAAISNDEVIGSSLSASASDTITFRSSEVAKLSSVGDGSGNQELSIQSRAEESLSVALPADLSVETPSLSLWLPLPSPQNASNPIQPPMPGAPHYPYYEMNPMVGGPIFAFGPHDESAVALPQLQKSSTSSTGPVGAWQQCHSGADSFYGPPTGFTGPFISPPRGIPGMQVPPHMVVYNHFAPLGQFGQVGLSFMGTTYIPSEKQPDWKHTSISSGMGISEGDTNMNMVSSQRNLPNIPGPIQHLAPGSSLLPMPSPLAMFDLPSFQSSTEMPMQSCWPHIPASPHHSVPLSMPLQQQVDGALPSQFNHGLPVDPSTGKRFKESRAPTPADNSRNFTVTADATSHFPDELGLLESSDTSVPCVSTSRPGSFGSTNGPGKNPQSITQSTSRSNVANARESANVANNTTSGSGNSSIKDSQSVGPMFKSQIPHQQSSAYLHPIGYSDQRRSGVSSKSMSGGEWHRRVGFQGRNQGLGADKNFLGPSKVKRVYVAKSTAPGTPATTS